MIIPLWWRRAEYVRAIDGDTLEVKFDLGFGIMLEHRYAHIRLLGINTPELNASDPAVRERANAAKADLESLCAGRRLMVQTFKDSREKYGRYLGQIHVVLTEDAQNATVNDVSVNQMMIDRGWKAMP